MNTMLFRLFLIVFLVGICAQTSNAQWISNGSTPRISLGEAIARDAIGNVYGVGTFTCNLVIQGDTLRNPSCGDTTTAPFIIPRFDGYLVKYSSIGKLLWAKQLLGNVTNSVFEIKGISISPTSIYITGNYSDTITVGGTLITNVSSNREAFVACFDLNGNFNWVKTNFTRSISDDIFASSISASSDGNVVFTGTYKGQIISTGNQDTLKSTTKAFFLMKLDASGNRVWSKSSKEKNASSKAEATDVWQSSDGTIFLAGNASGTVYVQPDSIHFAIGKPGIFISKFTSSGQLKWLKKDTVASINSIELDKSEAFFLVGGNYKNNNALAGTALTTTANYGAYVARYDTSGVMKWVKTLTVPAADSAATTFGVSGDTFGDVYAIGNYGKRTSTSATLTSGSKNTKAKAGITFFVAKFKQNGNQHWLQTCADGSADSGADIIAYDSSEVYITGFFNKIIRIDSSLVRNKSVGLNSFIARIDNCPFIQAALKIPVDTFACKRDSIRLEAVTGSGFLYQWQKNGVDISGATASNFYAKDSALYRVVVHSSNPSVGCIKFSPEFLVVMYPLPDTIVSWSGKLEFCEGQSVTLNAKFGNKYQWLKSGSPLLAGDTLSSYTVKTSGLYQVALTTKKGCKDTSRAYNVISEPIPAPLITPAGKFIICDGDSLVMETSVFPMATYQWYNNGFVLSHDTLPKYKALTSGRYSVRVKNRLGCGTYSPEDTLFVYSAPIASLTYSGNLNTCDYDRPTLYTTANATINTIEWYKDGTIIPAINGNVYTPSETGIYTIKVTNSNNCSNESILLNVHIFPQPIAAISNLGNSTFCANDSVSLLATTGTYTYRWQRNSSPLATAQNSTYYVKQAGNYRVILTDINQCSDTSNVLALTAYSVPVASISAIGNRTFCIGDSVSLSTTSGTGLAYEWFKNGVGLSTRTNRIEVIKATGDYSVRVYNTIGCADTSVQISVHVYSIPPNTIVYSNPLDFCAGNQVTLSAVKDPAFLYQWRKNNVAIASGGNNADYLVTKSGTYNVVISINSKCTNTSIPLAVTVKPVVKPVITIDKEFISTAEYLSYQWYKNGVLIPAATHQIYHVIENGQYSIQVSDANDCSTQADLVTVCIPVPEIKARGNFLTSTLGNGYQWYVNNVAISNATNYSYLVNATGDYKILVSRADGCISFSNTLHICIPPPVITLGTNNVLTSSAGFKYQWFLNGTILPNIDTRIIVADQTGDYSVQVEDLSGCISMSMPISIAVDDLSVGDGFKNISLKSYPNPFDKQLTIEMLSERLPAKAYIYDMNGSQLIEIDITTEIETIQTEQLPSGSYVLMLVSESQRNYYNLIKIPR